MSPNLVLPVTKFIRRDSGYLKVICHSLTLSSIICLTCSTSLNKDGVMWSLDYRKKIKEQRFIFNANCIVKCLIFSIIHINWQYERLQPHQTTRNSSVSVSSVLSKSNIKWQCSHKINVALFSTNRVSVYRVNIIQNNQTNATSAQVYKMDQGWVALHCHLI